MYFNYQFSLYNLPVALYLPLPCKIFSKLKRLGINQVAARQIAVRMANLTIRHKIGQQTSTLIVIMWNKYKKEKGIYDYDNIRNQ